MNKQLFMCLACMMMLSACNRKVGAIFSKKDKLAVIDPVFQYLTAKAKFKFDHQDKKVSATANFRIQKDSVVWISISGFGFEGARVFIDNRNVRILDRLKKQYYEYTFAELSNEYGFDFNFQLIQSVILGNLMEPYKRQKISQDNDYFSYDAIKGAYLFHNFIGRRTMKLEKVVVSDEDSKNTISVNYNDFVLVKDQVFPNEILAVIDYGAPNKSNTEISISYNRMDIEDDPISFPYSVPSKYEKK